MSVTLLYGISFSGYGHIFGVALSLLLNQSMQKGGVCLPVWCRVPLNHSGLQGLVRDPEY